MKDTIYTHMGDTLTLVGDSMIIPIKTIQRANDTARIEWVWLLLLTLVFLVAVFAFFYNYKQHIELISKHLKSIAAIVWVGGCILYGIGFWEDGTEWNLVALIGRATLSSLEMFVSHSDLIEVRHSCHESKIYMFLFALVHLMAVLISVLFIVKWIGFKALSKAKIFRWRFSKETGNLYVFWGVNNSAINLAKSIQTSDKSSKMIFVDIAESSDEAHLSRFSFSHFFHSGNDNSAKFIDRIRETAGVLLKAEKPFNKSSLTNLKNNNLFSTLGINVLGFSWCDELLWRSIEHEKVTFFLLSDDEKTNISTFIALKSITAFNTKNFECYCHARRNKINDSIFETSDFKNHSHLIDSSSLAIQILKTKNEYHPVNFVEHKAGMVCHPFTAMVIGFGETGRDAFRFLYEYGSFVKCVSKGKDGRHEIEEQRKKIYVVDNNLLSLKADFLVGARALKDDNAIEWHNLSTHSEGFTNCINSAIKELNYIVIAIDDEDEAISLATRLYRMAYSMLGMRGNQKLGIFVRVQDNDSKERLETIINYFEKHDKVSQVSLHQFGDNETIFTYDNINTNNVEKKAQKFFYEYAKKSAEIDNNVAEMNRLGKTTAAEEWQKRRNESGKSSEERLDLFYKEEQDRSNAYHVYTKRKLAGLLTKNTERINTQEDVDIIDVLGYCEHLRWNAKMKLMNFVVYEKDDDIEGLNDKKKKKLTKIRKYEHDCILSCNELIRGVHKDTFKYDRRVAVVSIEHTFE